MFLSHIYQHFLYQKVQMQFIQLTDCRWYGKILDSKIKGLGQRFSKQAWQFVCVCTVQFICLCCPLSWSWSQCEFELFVFNFEIYIPGMEKNSRSSLKRWSQINLICFNGIFVRHPFTFPVFFCNRGSKPGPGNEECLEDCLQMHRRWLSVFIFIQFTFDVCFCLRSHLHSSSSPKLP